VSGIRLENRWHGQGCSKKSVVEGDLLSLVATVWLKKSHQTMDEGRFDGRPMGTG
jgi:hypothetical protein